MRIDYGGQLGKLMLVVVMVIDETTMRMFVVGWLCGCSRWMLVLMGESEFVTLYKIFSPYHDMKICSSMMNKYFWLIRKLFIMMKFPVLPK